jgi:hypothetical protein
MKRIPLVSLLTAGLVAVAAAPAAAAPATFVAATGCAAPALAPALSAFGDPRSYFVAPGGDFEGPAWKLAGGATLTDGSGPLRLGSARGSLKLPPGGSATSPIFCVDLEYPTMRFFSAQRAAWSSSKLTVDVMYPALGMTKPKAATLASGSPAWVLSRDVKLRPETVTRSSGWRYVQLRFTADKAMRGDWRVDDVLVDPRMRG